MNKSQLSVEQIAEVAHEVNRAYCKALGDFSQMPWEKAPDWQRQSAINGVKYHHANPNVNPSDSHDNWLHQKEQEGWKYGLVKDSDKKEHPCCVPYDMLPTEQKAKDYIFQAIVHAL